MKQSVLLKNAAWPGAGIESMFLIIASVTISPKLCAFYYHKYRLKKAKKTLDIKILNIP